MTNRVALAVTVLLVSTVPAEANWWDVIKQLSGPGPSDTRGNVVMTYCWLNRDTLQNEQPCFFFDLRRFETRDGSDFPNKVRFQAHDAGLTWQILNKSAELGFGAGLMRFQSEDRFRDRGELTVTRLTFTAPRAVIAPVRTLILLFSGRDANPGKWASVLKAYGRVNVIVGRLDTEDFGIPFGGGENQSRFTARNDVVWSNGFIIDGLALAEVIFRR
jgi:hypothetical protein